MCMCDRNWQANDCSERVCLYGLAHVDTPKGDLDMSGSISGPDHPVIENSATFPYGTTEQFPQMEDTDLNVLTQSAHYYQECSNKGICDRKSGECECFDGYDGAACQRASCPGWPLDTCSGHGRCLTAAQMAHADYGNSYRQWDKDSTMGCKCDSGYHGAACDQRACKVGIDPLYLDDSATIKFSTFDLATLTTAPGFSELFDRSSFFTAEGVLFNDGTPQGRPGYWAIRFFDSFGEDWVTNPVRAGASCNEVVRALEALPNAVVPKGLTLCTRSYNAAATPDGAWSTTGARGVLAACTTSISGGASRTMNVASTTQGALKVGAFLRGQGIPPGTFVTDISGLSGGAGTVTVSQDVNVGAVVVVAYSPDLGVEMVGSLMSGSRTVVVDSISTGVLVLGMTITGLGIADGVTLSAYAPAVPLTALTITGNSVNVAVLQVSSVANLYVGQAISGTGVPPGVHIESISGSSLRLTNLVTVSAGAVGVVAEAIPAGSAAGTIGVYLMSEPARSNALMLALEAFQGTAPPPIYDAAHPATSKHPYKITYRMSIWDAYAALDAVDVGEGGAYTPIVWAPGSYPNTNAVTWASGGGAFNTPLVTRAHTSGSGNTIVVEPPGVRGYFTATAAGVQGDATITLTSVRGLLIYFSHLYGSSAFPPGGVRVVSVDATTLVVGIDPPLLAALSGGTALFAQTQQSALMDQHPLTIAVAAGARTLVLPPNSVYLPPGQGVCDSGDVKFIAAASTSSTTLTVTQTLIGALVNGMTVSGCGIVGRAVVSSCAISSSGAGTCTLDSAQSTKVPPRSLGVNFVGACVGSPAVFYGTTNGAGTLLAITSVTSGALVDPTPISGGRGITATGVTLSGCSPAADATASAAGTTLTITALAGANPLVNGMVVTGTGILGTVTLSGCSIASGAGTCIMSAPLTFSSTTVSGSRVCTLSSTQTVSLDSPLYGVDATWAAGSAIAPGTIILDTDFETGRVTLSKPLLAPLPAFKQLLVTPFASLAPGMLFTIPMTTTPSKITAVSGPDALGLYTLTFSGLPRTFIAGDSVRVLQGGQSIATASRHAPLSGYIYRLRFLGNPGRLRQPEIITHLDGRRNSLMSVNFQAGDYDPSTLASGESHYKVITKVWTDGQQGEAADYFADHCDDVQVRVGNYGVSLDGSTVSETTVELDGGAKGNVNAAARFFLTALSADKKARLKKCLGASDFDDTNNVGTYNWDSGADASGTITFPHLIKLVRTVTAYTDGGYYAALFYSETDATDGEGGTFFLLNPFSPPDGLATDWYDVYTTKGTLALTSSAATAVFGFASKTIYTVTNAGVPPPEDEVKNTYDVPSTGSTNSSYGSYDGDVSCVRTLGNGGKFAHLHVAHVRSLDSASNFTVCLAKADIVTFLNTGQSSSGMNPPHLNLYTVTRLEKRLPQWSNWQRYGHQATPGYDGKNLQFMTNEVHLDLATNWGSSVGSPSGSTFTGSLGGQEGIDSLYNSSIATGFALYKFFPHVDSTYEYAAPCSNRGSCNVDLGLCECFSGYTGDDCHQQTTLAL